MSSGHLLVALAVEQAHRAVDGDLLIEEKQLLARLPEARATVPAARPRLASAKAPVGEVGRGGDPDQRQHALGTKQRQVKREPAAH